ncbi:hypothetical protein [Kibdelosporangium aridum]|uniref:hypothetical protein n=1 Tax=Kibdelosporangium aridum TaxID=2030 RepID=UPI0035E5E1AF
MERFLLAYAVGHVATNPTAEALIDSMSRMTIKDTPFVHGVIDDFLPDSVYEAVREQWPAPSSLMPVRPGKGGNYVGSREARLIEEWQDGGCSASAVGAFQQVADGLRHPNVLREFSKQFASVIEKHLFVNFPEVDCKPGFRLYQCVDQGVEESLGAHVDSLRKLFTVVIYIDLAGELTLDSERLWGTTLYHARSGDVTPVSFSSNYDHAPAGNVEFKPNRAFVMPNNSIALHGVTGGQSGVRRRTLMCGYWAFGEET